MAWAVLKMFYRSMPCVSSMRSLRAFMSSSHCWRADLKDAVEALQQADVVGAAAEIQHEHRLRILPPAQAVRHCRRHRLCNDNVTFFNCKSPT